jgi:phosphoenolpyruvate carboxykinase (GTP)
LSTPLETWVEESARLTKPAQIVWCDGSEQESERLNDIMLKDGTFHELNEKTFPNCHLHRSNPNDVARTENLTFICTRDKEDVGFTNNWMAPEEAKAKLRPLFDGAMKGRTMYVVPYVLGPANSPYSKIGVEITDSPYVAASMRIMSRMGKVALDRLGSSSDFVPGLHSLGDLNPERRFIMHFPEEKLIWSIGSGYGGNALLGKKCFALRIASWMAREEGWMAEHMLILGLEDPSGKVTYMAAAFPSACGKTNLAMMVSALEKQGYRVWTVGDDIAWMHIGSDGTLRAINPEAGFFGVAPGTNALTNPNVMKAAHKNTIYTNVAITDSREPWWEGIDGAAPKQLTDWKGQNWTPGNGAAAHPNARYTVPAAQSPSLSKHWEDPEGLPISAIIFGGRRARLAPLVYESQNWQHGVFVGATMASETTAAATGAVGVTRRDPMAMLPFAGYNMGDYFGHWLAMGKKLKHPPKIFHVNWFRKGADGKFLWPGYGENVRVLKWMLDRIEGRAAATETAIGFVPTQASLTLDGLSIPRESMDELLRVDSSDWAKEEQAVGEFFDKFGSHLPEPMRQEHRALGERLSRAAAATD